MQFLATSLWYPHTHLAGLCPGLPRWAGTRKVKPIWILLKRETVSGSGISWAICKSAHRSRLTNTSAPHHSVVYRPYALPSAQPTASTIIHGSNLSISSAVSRTFLLCCQAASDAGIHSIWGMPASIWWTVKLVAMATGNGCRWRRDLPAAKTDSVAWRISILVLRGYAST